MEFSPAKSGVFVDTLSFTIPYTSLINPEGSLGNLPDLQIDRTYSTQFIHHLKTWFISLDIGLTIDEPKGYGQRFYKNSSRIIYTSGSDGFMDLGSVYFDGNADTINFYLTGECMQFINMNDLIKPLHDHLFKYDTRLTRVDLALDFMSGEYTVEDAANWFDEGYFNTNGRPPSCSDVNFRKGTERTFYVGTRQSTKFFRAYEKGHQLGDLDSNWNRYEIQYSSQNKANLPLDMLIDCASYFKNAYPMMDLIDSEYLRDVSAKAVKHNTVKKLKLTVDQCIENAKTAYGKLVNTLTGLGYTSDQILSQISRPGLPSRLIVPDSEPAFYFREPEQFWGNVSESLPI